MAALTYTNSGLSSQFHFVFFFRLVAIYFFRRESTASPKKSPGSQVHAHFFPQQYSVERFEPGDITIDTTGGIQSAQLSADGSSSDQPRRMYVREQFTHENTAMRGNVGDSGDGVIRR